MPGIFGAGGSFASCALDLERHFVAVWGEAETRTVGRRAVIGGHSFGGSALREDLGVVRALDGERQPRDSPEGSASHTCGSEARVRPDGTVELRVDPTGSFPLYYTSNDEGIAFSSHLRAIRLIREVEADSAAIAVFLREGFTYAGRTPYRGVRRLLPGQILSWVNGKGATLRESSRAWSSVDGDLSSPEEAADSILPFLRAAMESGIDASADRRLMLSAGWDSRTLLAAAMGVGQALEAYSHGDVLSRELSIARRLAERAGIDWVARPIEADVWDLGHLERVFDRTECLVFPHWAWAGRSRPDVSALLSGVLGEVLGGHYGGTMIGGNVERALSLVRGMAPLGEDDELDDSRLEELLRSLSPTRLDTPWYLDAEVESDPGALLDEIQHDVFEDVARLAARDIGLRSQLLEAFITEHRGVQYICAQPLSARCDVDIALPFGETEFFEKASSIPSHLKIHNRVNRSLVRALAPELLRPPMAATLVPASSPLIVQECSRLGRKLLETGGWRFHALSGRGARQPRWGWVDFEFLRSREIHRPVVESLRGPFWNMDAIRAGFEAAAQGHGEVSMHSLFDQMGKILTIDRLFS